MDDFVHMIDSLDVRFDVTYLSEVWSSTLHFFSCILPHYDFYFDLPKTEIDGGVYILTNH